ncbi:MAG: hypothetical protein HYV40_03900 [Candidatus Levybacteria bacterium]|nr:hypothetical protein [Candidatus Levybacteria bacterium]
MNKKILLLVALLVIGYIFISPLLFSANKTANSTSVSTTSQMDTESETENATYGHVHALFELPDKTLLMGTHHGLFKSGDDGKTFTKVAIKGDVNSDDFMNFAYDQTNKILYAGGHDVGVVKSTDGGTTWTKIDSGIKGTDIHALAINPLDSNRLYAFSVDNGLFGSKDGAKTWYRIDDGPINPSVRAFGYMATPSSMDRGMKTDKTTNIGYLWAGTSGGLYSSFACFCGWTKTNGISDNATIYTLAPDPVNKSTMFAGTKDGIFKTTDEGKIFNKMESGITDVSAITFDFDNPEILYAAESNGTVYKSEDNGSTWNKVQ